MPRVLIMKWGRGLVVIKELTCGIWVWRDFVRLWHKFLGSYVNAVRRQVFKTRSQLNNTKYNKLSAWLHCQTYTVPDTVTPPTSDIFDEWCSWFVASSLNKRASTPGESGDWPAVLCLLLLFVDVITKAVSARRVARKQARRIQRHKSNLITEHRDRTNEHRNSWLIRSGHFVPKTINTCRLLI